MQPSKKIWGHCTRDKTSFTPDSLMKKILIGFTALFLLACKEITPEEGKPKAECFTSQILGELANVEGQIENVAGFFVIKVGDKGYYPCNLPENLKISGITLRFNAQVFATPANIRLPAGPILIPHIYSVVNPEGT